MRESELNKLPPLIYLTFLRIFLTFMKIHIQTKKYLRAIITTTKMLQLCYSATNIKTNESWLSFRHRCLYTWSLSLSLRLVKTNIVENISLIFKSV